MIVPYQSSLLLDNYREDIIKYTRNNFCCEDFPRCLHPLFQSDKNIFKEEKFKDIKFEFYNLVENYFQKEIEVVYEFVWSYLSIKNQTIGKDTWHHHEQPGYKVDAHISGILYFEDSPLGTEFKKKDFRTYTNAIKNKWYLWPSNFLHRPEPGLNKKERLCIATATGIKFK
jgi:hypothetical protein